MKASGLFLDLYDVQRSGLQNSQKYHVQIGPLQLVLFEVNISLIFFIPDLQVLLLLLKIISVTSIIRMTADVKLNFLLAVTVKLAYTGNSANFNAAGSVGYNSNFWLDLLH